MVTGKVWGSQFGLARMVLAASLGLGLAALLLACASASVRHVFAIPVQGDSSGGHYLPPRAPAAVTLTRGPYLQSVTTDSIIVAWETNGLADSRVDYGPTAGYGLGVSSDVSVTHHALTLTGLSPYSLYHYRVSSDGLALGGDSTFRAAAGPTQTGFSFVVFGDTATNGEAHKSVVNRAVALVPDFVLHSGDFVEDGRVAAQWITFFSIEQVLLRQSPLYGALGNDEMSSTNYFDVFHLPGNERWYSFDYGDAHIAALEMDDDSDFEPGNPQYTWLDNDLANTDRQWKIVFFHIPPYTFAAQSTLVPLLARHGVDVVFNGHAHLYERTVFSDVMYIISGGGGEPLYSGPLNPYSAYYTSTHHCVLVTINGRSLTSVGVRPDGLEFDRFTLYSPPVAAFESSSPGWLGQTILFTNTTLTSGATIYEWALGDGAKSTEENPTHAYVLPGLYTVTLTATNPAGSHRAIGTVAIYGAPTARFTAYPIIGPSPLTVIFTDETTTGPLGDPTLIHLWQFGDRQTSALRVPAHTYTVVQVYTVTLAVTNAAGSDMVARANYITVYEPLNVYLPLILSHSSRP